MSYLFILLSFLFIGQPKSNDPRPKTLSISVTGEVELPADQIQFNINVNADGETPQAAYNLQKKREAALVALLDKYDVTEKNIHYQPISINKQRVNRGENNYDTTYVTRQSVHLTLSDFDVFDNIQIALIENGFDSFNANFTSSRMEEGKTKALKAAIKNTKEKAQLIAETAGVSLGSVQQISYGAGHSPSPVQAFKVELRSAPSDNLLKYDQTVTVSASISMQYSLSDS